MHDDVRMDGDLVVRGSVVIAQSELSWRFSRASGPGGQGVNTTDSRAQLVFDLQNSPSIPEHLKSRALRRLASSLHDGRITITASEHRSQLQNRRSAERRLLDTLREAMAPPPKSRRATRPSKGAVDRRIREKKSRGVTKRLRQGRDLD